MHGYPVGTYNKKLAIIPKKMLSVRKKKTYIDFNKKKTFYRKNSGSTFFYLKSDT